MPVYHFSAICADMFLNLFIHPILNTGFFHEMQISNNIFMMHNTVYNVYGNKILKALAREIAAFIAACYALFFCAFSKPMTTIYTFCRNSAGKASFTFLRK